MAHQFTITTGTDASLSTLNDSLSATTLERVLTDRDQTFSERETTDGTTEYRATVYAADTEARADVLADLESVVTEATTATIDHRHTYAEYDDARIADPSYYHADAETGHRTDPTAEHAGGWTVDAETAYHIADTEHTATQSFTIDPPSKYARRDRIVADADGLRVITGESFDEPNGTAPPDAPPTPTDAVSVAVVTVKAHIDRIPHGGIELDTLVGDPSATETLFQK